jgi:hypothetical protein
MLAGDIGFTLANGQLPWSTLEHVLAKKGCVVVNWPQGVTRDNDKGASVLIERIQTDYTMRCLLMNSDSGSLSSRVGLCLCDTEWALTGDLQIRTTAAPLPLLRALREAGSVPLFCLDGSDAVRGQV